MTRGDASLGEAARGVSQITGTTAQEVLLTSASTRADEARRVLTAEADAILAARERLNDTEFDAAVDLLLRCSGKVILVGSGKSGIAARKIAATLTATGTPAVFLHAGDALHGDVGITTGNDCVVAVSNSGETEEVVALVAYLKERGIPVVAVIGERMSTLARQADAVIDASVGAEACPLNLAPTSSTTLALALGDALAVTLMATKGFGQSEFAMNHPAGTLGKRLRVLVRDLMHAGDHNPTVAPDAMWLEVVQVITAGGLGAVNVVQSRTLTGIITDGDLRRSMQRFSFRELEAVRASEFMTADPVTIGPNALAHEALRLMEERPSQISVLPVVEEERVCVGLLRLHDIVGAGLR